MSEGLRIQGLHAQRGKILQGMSTGPEGRELVCHGGMYLSLICAMSSASQQNFL